MDLALALKRLRKVRAALRSQDFRRALRRRVLPAIEHLPVLQKLPPVALVVDVGANVGQFAIVARHCWPAATIVSFEPLPAPAAKLAAVFADDPRFDCRPIALTDHAGTAPFHMTGQDDSSSLLKITPRQVAEFATDEVAVLEVTTARLDDVLDGVDLFAGPVLLKLDTQGTELDVLKGGTKVLERVDHVVVEISFVELYEGQSAGADVVRFLLDCGWDVAAVYDVKTSRRTGEPLQADLLFSRQA